VVFQNNLLMGASGNQGEDYTIDQSCRFNSADSAYLTQTPGGSASSVRLGTISVWVKRSIISTQQALIHQQRTSDTYDALHIVFRTDDTLQFAIEGASAATVIKRITTQVFRDPSAWYHFVFAWDSNQTDDTSCAIYVNGEAITDFGTKTNPGSAQDLQWLNTSKAVWVGRSSSGSNLCNVYMSEMAVIDGSKLAASSFGETNSTTGQWVPKDITGLTYGNEGWLFAFQDSSALGDDTSGNGNDFTSSGLAAADQMSDSPTDNQCTLNPLGKLAAYTLSDGNLVTNAAYDGRAFGTVRFDVEDADGFYFEAKVTTAATYPNVGIRMAFNFNDGGNSTGRYWFRGQNGNFYNPSGDQGSYGDTWAGTADKVIGCLVKAGSLYFSVDGTVQDSGTAAATGLTGYAVPTVFYDAGSGTSAAWEMRFAANMWSTTPTGYKAISTANLPDPTIAKPSEYFSTVLYAGDGSDGYEVTGVGFEPDMFWLKNRAAAENHYVFDSVRGVGTGAGKHISPNEGTAEVSDATVKAITSDGFTVEATGAAINTGNHVVWSWLEDATSGFDIVSYTGNGSNRTISHSLGAVPGQMIIKNLDTEIDWAVYNEGSLWHGAANLGYLTLNTTAVSYDNDEYWNDTTPTSSVFTVGTHNSVNKDSSPMIAYLWAGVEGFSSFGKYEGNGSTDGPLILTGFKPRFIVCKSYTQVKGWNMFDSARSTYNVAGAQLQANLDEAEATLNAVDLLSNGFKLRTADNAVNRNGYGFIYMAWAESSFKYATAR